VHTAIDVHTLTGMERTPIRGVRIGADWLRLQSAAKEQNVTTSAIVRALIRRYLRERNHAQP